MKVRQKVFLIIFIAVFSMAIAGATYAFLQPGWRRFSDGFDVGAASGGTGTFTAYSNGNIEMKVQDAWMAENLVSGSAMVEDNASVTIEMDGGTSSETWTCTYDLIWVWDSEDKFTEPDVPLPYTHTDGKVYPYEFSIKVGDDPEKDLSSFTWNNNRTILQTRTLSVEKNEHSKMTIPIVTKMYNIPVIQNKFSDKLYKGHVIVSEPRCTQTPTILAVAETKTFLADAIKKMYTKDGEGGLYYHDGKGDYTNASLEAGDNSYRYAGTNPNNFLCFGTEEEVCPEDNLYRIIGVFGDRVKVIKNKYLPEFHSYNEANSSIWEGSDLEKYLNGTYLTSLANYGSYIYDTTWISPSISSTNVESPKTVKDTYSVEMASTSTSTVRKFGLLYLQEYGYAASPKNWALNLKNYSASLKDNWLLLNDNGGFFTLTRNPSIGGALYTISGNGNVSYTNHVSSVFPIRPVFSLKNNIFYMGGNGTKDDPIRVDNKSFSTHIISKYTADGENDMYYHDGTGSYTNANLEAGDNSYRYSGANPNNYVCFDGTDCMDANNLYRIIGVFGNNVKLIKLEPADYKQWHTGNITTFDGTAIDTYLNNEWLNSLGDKANLIASSTLRVGSISSSSSYTAKNHYDLEKAITTTLSRKVGLMYPSEYGYAMNPEYWSTPLYNYYNNASNDWMYLKISKSQWTIAWYSSTSVAYLSTNGTLFYSSSPTSSYAIRPTFSLKSITRYISGDGSYDNPYVIG